MVRREFDKKVEARAVLKKLPPEQLNDKKACQAAIKAARINLSPIAIGRLRKELSNGQAGTNGAASSPDTLLRRVRLVKKTIKAVGGLDNLNETIRFIETVRAIQ